MDESLIAGSLRQRNGDLGYGRNRLDTAQPKERVFLPITGIKRSDDEASKNEYAFYSSITDYRREQKINFDATASYGNFSGEFHLEFLNKFSSRQECVATLHTYKCEFSQAWLSAVSEATLTPEFVARSKELPIDFTDENAHEFYSFFHTFGTETVVSINLDGSFYFQSYVEKSKFSNLEKIKIAVEAEYAAAFTAEGEFDRTIEHNEYKNSRTVHVHVEGGHVCKIARNNDPLRGGFRVQS
jgi:hypothetical protein